MAGVISMVAQSNVTYSIAAEEFYMVPNERWLSGVEKDRPAQRWEVSSILESLNSRQTRNLIPRPQRNAGRAIPNCAMAEGCDEAVSKWVERRWRRRKLSPGSYGEMLRGHVMNKCLQPRSASQEDESSTSQSSDDSAPWNCCSV
mmetsp:Transcript_9674/g.21593  ORF Transcript_9674/g.21593 Transcript_9674/m.21593 type:complete len:145 (-) Transcript_9674:358-792(-)|eukprot:CAMPEP_0170607810 /NCGR_PEP_ID=MMETSP0224-20130122/21250_1 /TAXON_ID=285029 /ORGANISM="Togula jolla, Strain CCCM 725" /LENGTH=144 /DNA_ID=CAMNT_0010932995 /DNA_START=42 /DNA_END=476 /DNA_ORIENTATION=-